VEAFGTVLIVVCVLGIVAAAISYWGSGKIYSGLGRTGGLSMDDDVGRPAASEPGLRDEVRQLVQARNERRQRQGKAPLDVEAEVDRELRDLGGDGGLDRV
jgi:hypothetical protein